MHYVSKNFNVARHLLILFLLANAQKCGGGLVWPLQAEAPVRWLVGRLCGGSGRQWGNEATKVERQQGSMNMPGQPGKSSIGCSTAPCQPFFPLPCTNSRLCQHTTQKIRVFNCFFFFLRIPMFCVQPIYSGRNSPVRFPPAIMGCGVCVL
jgi:hypothetical protein